MKRLVKVLTLVALTSTAALTSALGQAGPTFSFDEWGTSLGLGAGSVVAADPSGGVTGPVLVYTMPFAVIPGDVLIGDPLNGALIPSDVVRFWNIPALPNQSLIIFYSDRPEAGEIPPPADVGLPTQIQPNFAGPFVETGTEAFNFFDYLATPGMPGSASAPILYHIISDGVVPEPNISSLAILGGGLLLALKQRLGRRAQ